MALDGLDLELARLISEQPRDISAARRPYRNIDSSHTDTVLDDA